MWSYLFMNNIFNLFFIVLMLSMSMFNNISIMMIMMVLFLMKMIKFSIKQYYMNYYPPLKLFFLNFMILSLMIFFSTKSLIIFYINFELISMLIFVLILYTSKSMERIKASIYIFFLMGLGTFPLLSSIFFNNMEMLVFIFLMSFLIKMPILFFHLWLSKAHVEANYYDSMLLASLLLKLGGYGLLNLDLHCNMVLFMSFWSLNTVMILSFYILTFSDMKLVLAYSSILHMNSMIFLISNNSLILENSFCLYMISHAICSSLMFFMIGMFYINVKSRNVLINKSMMYNNLIMFMLLFLVLFLNMGTPPFLTFFSEMYFYFSLINLSLYLMLVAMFMLFVSVLFNLNMIKNSGAMLLNKFLKLMPMNLKIIFLIFEHFLLMMVMV